MTEVYIGIDTHKESNVLASALDGRDDPRLVGLGSDCIVVAPSKIPTKSGYCTHPAAQLCDASVDAGGEYPRGTGAAWTLECGDHDDLYACHARSRG